MSFVCSDGCKGIDHDGKPTNCRGGTWCDCLHRPVSDTYKKEVENNE